MKSQRAKANGRAREASEAATTEGKARWNSYVREQRNGHADAEASSADEAKLPPHDDAAERGALGCILSAASERDADSMLASLHSRLFYDLRHQKLLEAFTALRGARRAVDLVTVSSHLGKDGIAAVGGVSYLNALMDAVPSVANFPYYLESLDSVAVCREALQAAAELVDIVNQRDTEGGTDLVRAGIKMLGEVLSAPAKGERPQLLVTDPETHLKFEPRTDLCLVGDHDITRGYEGVCVIGGPPGSGKSLVASSLALAGAIGKGEWMGRKVHRQFRTLVIQAENGALRLRNEFQRMKECHPGVDLKRWIRWSLPPEGGIPFHRSEFRRELSRLVRDFKPDVVVLDPWTAVAADDAAKDVVDKLAEIRACMPPGDDCPALVVVAHTRKPKAEGMRRGRGLLNELSGSLALGSTARCCYVLLPFTDDIKDDRLLWSCAKLSNGEAPADSVWHRRIGTFFAWCPDDPASFWAAADTQKERIAVSRDELRALYGERLAMKRKELVAAMVEGDLCAYQTAQRITSATGYLMERGWISETPGGLLALER